LSHQPKLPQPSAPTYNAKQRALSDKELEGLFKALPELKMQGSVRELFLFQLYTAVRPSEAREAAWDEIDLKTQRWTIPEARMKMKKQHLVPLTAPACSTRSSFSEGGSVGLGRLAYLSHPGSLPSLISR
jgi:integrase